MTRVLAYDTAAARRLASIYRSPHVLEQRLRVRSLLAPRSGEHILDVGSGPGYLACELAAAVQPAGLVCGIDVSPAMLSLARAHAPTVSYGNGVHFDLGDVTSLPFDDCSFDAACATQTLEFVPDVVTALAELRRVLKSTGRLLVLDTDWDSLAWHSDDPHRMARVLAGWKNGVAHPHLPRSLAPRLREAGLSIAHAEVFSILDLDGGEGSYTAGQMQHMAAVAAGRRGVTASEVDAWLEDLRSMVRRGRYFFSMNRYIFLCTKAR